LQVESVFISVFISGF